MRAVELIQKKRDGVALSQQELSFLIQGYTAGDIPDYQMAAFAMAVFFRGMNREETAWLTEAMMHSGDVLDLSRFGNRTVDKHSTGGVGDKTTMIVGPIVASLGGKVAKMTGRGLGHTGGTADKLESIPGFRLALSAEQFLQQVEDIGLAVIAQSGNLTPADKKLYALRDVTATVDSLPLIVSSIMSKKLAAGSHSIVLDVKIGSGAFMKTQQAGRELAESMVQIGKACGRKMAAVMTNMDVPLGACIGNALEVMEAVQVLQGTGPEDLTAVSLELAANMLHLSLDWDLEKSREEARQAIRSGAAFSKLQQWAAAQGADAAALEDFSRLPQPEACCEVLSPCSGYLSHMDAEGIGTASMLLGAGRAKKEDTIDPSAGIRLLQKTGDFVEKGQPLCRLYTCRQSGIPAARERFLQSLCFSPAQPEKQPLIYGVIR